MPVWNQNWKGTLKETSPLQEDEWQKESWRQLDIVSPTSLTNVTLLVAPLSDEFLVIVIGLGLKWLPKWQPQQASFRASAFRLFAALQPAQVLTV